MADIDDIINVMKQRVANYTVVIEKEYRSGTKKTCYSAYVPVLGVATDADSLESAQEAIKKLVEFHLESLAQEGEPIPVEKTPSIVTRFEAIIPENAQITSN